MFSFSRELRQLLWCLLKSRLRFPFSESQTIEDFGAALHLMRSDLEHLRSVFMAVENGDLGMLKSLGIKDSELGDVKFFLEKLVNTGFLDWAAFPLTLPIPKETLHHYFPTSSCTCTLPYASLTWFELSCQSACLSLSSSRLSTPAFISKTYQKPTDTVTHIISVVLNSADQTYKIYL